MSSYENMPLDEVLKLQKLDAKMLWHSNYWDGPLSGVCEVSGEMLWFDILIETEPEIPCPKEEECDAKIQAEIEAIGRTNIASPESDEEWGCPPDYDHNCYKIPSHRYYGVYRVDTDTMEEVKRRHALFQKYVGTHTDYDETGQRVLGAVNKREDWKVFYDTAKTWPTLDLKQELLGYFVW